MDTVLLTWRPANFVTVGLMVLAWALIYTVASQVGRRFAPSNS